MKRMLALILAMTLLLTTIPVLAEESGIWEERQYVDEFELPTGDTYVSNKYPIVGKFSNSATTDSSLKVYLFYDEGVISLLSLIHISEPTRLRRSRMPSSA